jgi:hypothetical protein
MSTLFLYNNNILSCLYYCDNISKNVTDTILDFIKNKQNKFLVSNKTFNFDPKKNKIKKLEILTNNHILTIDEGTTVYIIFDDIVINKYNNIQWFFKNKTINIIGKGPTFKNVDSDEDNIVACINNTINFVTKCDILMLNDLETINQIDISKLSNVKYIFIPEYLHFKGKKGKDNIWYKIYTKIKNYYNGKYILFNLYDTPLKNHQIFNIDSGYSTVITFTEFLSKYNYNIIKNINYYGVGISDKLYYNKIFDDNNLWDKKKVKIVKSKLNHFIKKYNLKCSFN